MKIMAGRDTEFSGEAWPGEGITRRLSGAGAAARSDQDGQGECHGRRPPGRRHDGPLQRDLSAMMADPPEDADFDALMAEMGELQEKIDAVDGWTLDNQLEIAMDALRCPPGDSPVDEPVRRREAPRRADPAAARKARHPAARRADQPSRRRERAMAGKASRRLCRQRHPRHPRPLLPRQCRELGARARSRPLLRLRDPIIPAIWRRKPRGWSRRSARSRASRRRSTTSSNGSAARPRPARPSPRPASAPSTSWSRRRRIARRARRRS